MADYLLALLVALCIVYVDGGEQHVVEKGPSEADKVACDMSTLWSACKGDPKAQYNIGEFQ